MKKERFNVGSKVSVKNGALYIETRLNKKDNSLEINCHTVKKSFIGEVIKVVHEKDYYSADRVTKVKDETGKVYLFLNCSTENKIKLISSK